MFAEFKGTFGKIVRVVPEKVQGITPRQIGFSGRYGTIIYCSGVEFSVEETPEEVAKKLQGLRRVT